MSGRDRYQTDTWYDVPFKKGKGSRHQQQQKETDQGVKFFVSNLPERCASTDLVSVLKGFGDIRGTYIARKYDRLGKRFGFVTFNKGRNMEDLEAELKDVWIGSYKLFIVPARFVDGKEIPRKKEKVWQQVKGKVVQEEGKDEACGRESIPVDVCVGDRRSFKDTLLNKESVNNEELEIKVDTSLRVFGEWYDRAVIVHLKTLEALTNLKVWLKNMNVNEVEIKYVGGLCVILVFPNRDAKMVFTANKNAWGIHVDLLEEWYGQTFTVPRIAWLKIHGVPLSLSCSKVFEDVATKFGSIIHSVTFPEEDGDLSVACVGILRSVSGRVNQKVILNWKSSKFDVWVEEDLGDWIPECLVDMEDEESDMEETVDVMNENLEDMFDLNVAHVENSINSGVEADGLVGTQEDSQVHIGEKTPALKKRKGFCRKKGYGISRCLQWVMIDRKKGNVKAKTCLI
ncbi:putative RNA recognition motif domain, nucleotide-binding alpha-beta plait domain superfamily [Helianthus annuus]|nr:putative RNA recognition motif domain, nucleotide-binding alpha-beta plait domain superfamily [Helianthus annuus]